MRNWHNNRTRDNLIAIFIELNWLEHIQITLFYLNNSYFIPLFMGSHISCAEHIYYARIIQYIYQAILHIIIYRLKLYILSNSIACPLSTNDPHSVHKTQIKFRNWKIHALIHFPSNQRPISISIEYRWLIEYFTWHLSMVLKKSTRLSKFHHHSRKIMMGFLKILHQYSWSPNRFHINWNNRRGLSWHEKFIQITRKIIIYIHYYIYYPFPCGTIC